MSALPVAVPGAGGQSVFEITLNATEVQQLLDRFQLAVGGISLMLFLENDAKNFFHDDIESRFEEEGDAKSGFWEPLHDATVDIRRADGFADGPINVRTGELKDFLLGDYDVFTGADWSEMNVPGSPGSSETAKKMATAQQGSDDNPLGYGPTVPRPVLAVSEMDLMKLVELLEYHIMKFAMVGLH